MAPIHFRKALSCLFVLFFWPVYTFCECPTADLNGDCIVDLADLMVITNSWLMTDLPDSSGFVAHWALNETTGEVAVDSIGGHTGWLHGNPQWMPSEGTLQGAVFLDGIDDYIEITGYKGIIGTSARTCAAWIKTTSALDNPILSWGGPVAGQKWMFRIYEMKFGVGVWGGYIQTQKTLDDGQWHHVAAVLPPHQAPKVENIELYVDGVLESERYVSFNQVINTSETDDVLIGARIGGSSQDSYFRGMIDNVQIFNRALTSEEVLRLFQTGSAVRQHPDFTSDKIVNAHDSAVLSGQWMQQKPGIVINEFLAFNSAASIPDPLLGQIRDGNGDSSDWIELYNRTDLPMNLGNWGLTDNSASPFKWIFPAGTVLQGRSYMIIFASGKEKKDYPSNYPYVDPKGYLHTNFKLSDEGEYLMLVRPDGILQHGYNSVLNPETAVLGFPPQKSNIAYGLLNDQELYFSLPTPGSFNRHSVFGFVDAPQFSHERGFYDTSFLLTLSTSTPGAVIRYTLNGTNPTLANGYTYSAPVAINTAAGYVGRYVRAAAFKPGYQTSAIKTKHYLMNAAAPMKGLPAICLSGNPSEVFYNPNGIMAMTTEYNNMIMHGIQYERPVSMEYIHFTKGTEFQEDAGLRVHGSAWMRPRYTMPSIEGMWSGSSKISLRLYFRNFYGQGKFKHSILEKFPEVDEMDTFVLRAGHNDQSNPFVRDEMIRRLQYQMGHQAARGTFVNLFINGSYKGYYNLCERVEEQFCQKWFNSTAEWDVVGWVVSGETSSYLEAREGDMNAFNALISEAESKDLADPLNYAQVERQMDMTAFVDYIILQCWGGNWDWPQNNWSAAAERSPDRKWRFFVWDAEGCMDGDVNRDRFSGLSSDGSGLSRLYRTLSANADFKMLFADRLQKHFKETGGVMTQPKLNALFWELAAEVQSVIPAIDTFIPSTYIPTRESIFFGQCISRGLFTMAAPRLFLNGGEFKKQEAMENSLLTIQNASGVFGDIYYTLDGTDPRLSLSLQSESSVVTLVAENVPKRVLVPSGSIDNQWKSQVTFNDSAWNDGLPADSSKTGGVGYENNPGEATSNVPYISYNVSTKMFNNLSSACIRIPFTVNAGQLPLWNYLTLKMRYDDGFVAYINGTEVCRQGISGDPQWNSTAASHENTGIETFVISNYLSALQDGPNILAIHALNERKNSSDFVASAILEAGYTSTNGIAPEARKYTAPVALAKSAHVMARTLNGTQWSALQEGFVSVGSLNENLRISEFMYHPDNDLKEEFVEFKNIGTTPLNLFKMRFTNGVDFTFGDVSLAAGQHLLVVQDTIAFEARYGTGLPVAGQYTGALDNAGEKLQFSDIRGNPVQTIDYKDGWHDLTDGDGFSLTAVDPAYEKTGVSGGLDAHWTFDESTGLVAYDQTGNHHGTIRNMVNTARTDGHIEKGLQFDGVNDHVVSLDYKGITGIQNRTSAAWIKTTALQENPILSWGIPSTGGKWMLRTAAGGNLVLGVWDGYIQSSRVVNDGQWHHVAAVLPDKPNPTLRDVQLYIDGVLENELFISNVTAINTGLEDLLIAARIGGSPSDSYFQGSIDDVRIYNRALSADEIAVLVSDCWDRQELWRPGAVRGGTPGRDETAQEALPLPGSVVINELLAHSHDTLYDWIELKNTTGQNINIGGWFLSDSDPNSMKYRIPDGVTLTPAMPYYVIEETSFNNPSAPGCRIPFALSEGGETLYLQSAAGEQLTGYLIKEAFGATETGISLGRHQKSTATWNFVPMSTQTKGLANAYPKVGPLIISEIMYNPGTGVADQDYEYLELMNISTQSVRTAGYVSTYTGSTAHYDEWVPWKFTEGIEFQFPVNLTLNAGQRILLVKNLTAFNARYTGVPAGTLIYQWTGGSLANEGETVEISMPGDKEFEQERYWIRLDHVGYDNQLPWPVQAAATGKSLTHLRPAQTGNNYTNDPILWTAQTPTPGW